MSHKEIREEERCRTCDGLVQKNYDHVGSCSLDCFGTFTHARPLAKPCAFSTVDIGHGAVIRVPIVPTGAFTPGVYRRRK